VTLVFLHPIGLDGECWQFLDATELDGASRYTMLWHGDRQRPPAPLSLETMAADVVESHDGPLDLVGLSLGGAVAQHIALRYPDRVRSLLIAASSAGGPNRGTQAERAVAAEQSGMSGILDSTLRRWFSADALLQPSHPGVQYTRRRLLSDRVESFAAAWRALAAHDTLDRLGEISVPTTVLHPADDASQPLETKERMVERIPLSRLVVIPGPHLVQLESPEVFQAALLDHLAWAT
jgi:pimeloyl-ACP methyl ester carboxylesterase